MIHCLYLWVFNLLQSRWDVFMKWLSLFCCSAQCSKLNPAVYFNARFSQKKSKQQHVLIGYSMLPLTTMNTTKSRWFHMHCETPRAVFHETFSHITVLCIITFINSKISFMHKLQIREISKFLLLYLLWVGLLWKITRHTELKKTEAQTVGATISLNFSQTAQTVSSRNALWRWLNFV